MAKNFKSNISIEQGIAFPNKTAQRALIIDASNNLVSSNVTQTELERLSGLASAILEADDRGAANGVASLDGNSKIPSSQLPAIAITDVFQVADISARDALTVGTGDGEVQEGDVAVVTDASADSNITSGAASYIYSGSAWVLLKAGDEVLSVNGNTGVVVLDASDLNFTQDNTGHWTIADDSSIKATLDEIGSRLNTLEGIDHVAVTLNSDDATQQSLNLSGQEIQVNQATTSTDGVMSAEDKTKLDNIEALADVTDATNVDAAGAVMESDTSTASMSFVVDEDDMNSDSATKIPTQQSVKAYVDAQTASGGNLSSGDIKEASFTIADNQSSAANVTGLAFANGTVRSFIAQVSILRDATYEVYQLTGIQKAASWEMSIESVGDDTGVTFSITSAGQVQYTSTSTGSTATAKFRADTLGV